MQIINGIWMFEKGGRRKMSCLQLGSIEREPWRFQVRQEKEDKVYQIRHLKIGQTQDRDESMFQALLSLQP